MVIPEISKDLLEYLQKIFPDKLPGAPVAPEGLGVLIGQQKVIQHLQTIHNRQQTQEAGLPRVL